MSHSFFYTPTSWELVDDPKVLVPDPPTVGEWANQSPRPFKTIVLPGEYALVFPVTLADIYFLRSLRHRVEKWAQSDGSGTVVALSAMLAY